MRYYLLLVILLLAIPASARDGRWVKVGSVGFSNLGGNLDNLFVETNESAQVRVTLACKFSKPNRYTVVLDRMQWETLVDAYFEAKLINQRRHRKPEDPMYNTPVCQIQTSGGGEASILAISNHEGDVVGFQLRAPSTPPEYDYLYAPRVLIAYEERAERAFENLIEETARRLRRR